MTDTSARKKHGNTLLFMVSIAILLLAIGMHSMQYLPNTPGLFAVVFVARLILALAVSTGLAIAWTVCQRFFNRRKQAGMNGSKFWPVMATSSALVAVIMSAISLGNTVSEGLLQLYL